jgi:branched-chain amino acid transport system substrate-binding protein
MTPILIKLCTLMLAAPIAVARLASAETRYGPGVTDTEIKIGQTMPYSGPLSSYGTLGRAQAAYFAKINAEGGINGRKISLISLDDGFSPPKTLEQTRRMVERDGVLLLFSSFGTPTNSAIHKYVNAKGVPHLFLSAIAPKWGDPARYPWTMPWIPNFRTEAQAYAKYLLREKPNARIAILYQNDDGGKDFFQQFAAALGPRAQTMIVGRASYEPSDPTVDTQLISLKASGADTFMNFAYGKFAAQAIRKAHDSGWKPMQFLTWASSPIDVALKPVGFDKANGIFSTAFMKDPADPQWQDDPALRDYLEWQRRYLPEANPLDLITVMGYSSAQTLVYVLRQCGADLSRKSILRQAASLSDLSLPMLLPGVRIQTSAQDYLPIEEVRLVRFDGARWVRLGEDSGKPVAALRQR